MALVAALLVGCGGVTRTLRIASDPPGAQVVLDGRPVGTTPYEEVFLSHGVRRCELRLDGYRRLVVALDVARPWWQVFPLSFVTDVLWPVPLRDDHAFNLELLPVGSTRAGFADAEDAFDRFQAVKRFMKAREEAFAAHRGGTSADEPAADESAADTGDEVPDEQDP